MRNQNLPPITYMSGEQATVRSVEIKYRNEAVVEAKAALAELAEAEPNEIREEMIEDAQPGSRMSFVPKAKRDEQLYGSGLKGRTIGPDEDL